MLINFPSYIKLEVHTYRLRGEQQIIINIIKMDARTKLE